MYVTFTLLYDVGDDVGLFISSSQDQSIQLTEVRFLKFHQVLILGGEGLGDSAERENPYKCDRMILIPFRG